MGRISKYIHPDWALAHRKPGVELRFINNKYYLYACTGVYDPITKKSKKKTGKLLGTVTQKDGFVESEKRMLVEKATRGFVLDANTLSVREFGFTAFLQEYNVSILQKLKAFFPEHYQIIIYMAYCRFLYASPIKNFALHIAKSMLSVDDSTIYTDKKFSEAYRVVGRNREAISGYLKSFIKPNDHILVDLTNVFSASNNMRFAKEGYNADMIFDKQFNLLYIYSAQLVQPVFYKILAGNIKDVRGFKISLQEAGIKDAIIIADKGFYSKENVGFLKNEDLNFIIPLQRDSKLIDYSKLDKRTNQYFKFQDRYIWYYSYQVEGMTLYLFKDEKLEVQEQKDYLDRIVSLPEKYNQEGFQLKIDVFGTIAMVSDVANQDAKAIYCSYKSRNQIEVMFDGFKNILHADKTYMQNEDALEGYMLVNHIALQWYYIIYNILKNNDQISKYSVNDFTTHLKEIKKVRINDLWHTEPIIKASMAMLHKMKISIT